jgi:hypothetical protein
MGKKGKNKTVCVMISQRVCGHDRKCSCIGIEEGLISVTIGSTKYVSLWTFFGCEKCDNNAERRLKRIAKQLHSGTHQRIIDRGN